MPSSPPDQGARADLYSAAMGATEDIDLYLAGLPVEQRDAMSMLRRIIAEAVPEAEEAISYGMPAFRYRRRPLVGYKAAKAHVSLFPMSPAVVEAHGDRLRDWSTSKGTIRFTPEHPLPQDLVVSIVMARVAEMGGG
jgi:uncharacterized protein YdhG (YjbR/CyaY superfamily)